MNTYKFKKNQIDEFIEIISSNKKAYSQQEIMFYLRATGVISKKRYNDYIAELERTKEKAIAKNDELYRIVKTPWLDD